MATGYITMPCLLFPRARLRSTYHLSTNFDENSSSTAVPSSGIFFSVLKAEMGLGYTVQNKCSSLNLTPRTGNQNRTNERMVRKSSVVLAKACHIAFCPKIFYRAGMNHSYPSFCRNSKRSGSHVRLFHCFIDRKKPES